MNRSDIHFPPKHEPLRDDVHALGALVGEILREQGGQELFELVESDRVAAIRGRHGEAEARAQLAASIRGRPPALAHDLVRAFSTWFQAVNVAEKVHRIRRRREYFVKDSQRPQPGGVEDAIRAQERGPQPRGSARAHRQPVHRAGVRAAFDRGEPPHAAAASSSGHVAQRPLERLDPSLTPNEARGLWNNIRMELTTAWQTEELPRERSRWRTSASRSCSTWWRSHRVVPAFYEEIAQALEKVYGAPASAARVPAILHFGSWAGGDMDGNPDVHAKSIREALARQQQVIVNSYFRDCQELAQRLSQSASRVRASADSSSAPRSTCGGCRARVPSRPRAMTACPTGCFSPRSASGCAGYTTDARPAMRTRAVPRGR